MRILLLHDSAWRAPFTNGFPLPELTCATNSNLHHIRIHTDEIQNLLSPCHAVNPGYDTVLPLHGSWGGIPHIVADKFDSMHQKALSGLSNGEGVWLDLTVEIFPLSSDRSRGR